MTKYRVFILGSLVVIALLTFYFYHGLSKRPAFADFTVKQADVTQGLTESGTVQAAQTLMLSFQTAGSISAVPVQVGDSVTQGQVLAQLSSSSARASVDQAQAAVATAQANYQKLLNGATGDQVDVSQSAVASAQTALQNASSSYFAIAAQQKTLVQNALNTLLNTSITAVPNPGNPDSIIPTVSGTYTGSAQGDYKISAYATGSGLGFQASGLETANGNIQNQPTPLGKGGLFIQFASTPSSSDSWTISIPNTYASAYTTDYNAYQAALQTQNQALTGAQAAVDSAQSALAQTQAGLQLMQSAPRPEDIAAAKAAVATTEAALEAAQNNYNNTTITAPIAGTITEVDAKVGQTVAPGTPEIGLISGAQFQIITYISEDDLSQIKTGDPANVTLDAYGDGTVFPAQVISIDPSTSISGDGTPAYKLTLQFIQEDNRIKTGMAANISIMDQTESGVLAVPRSAIFTDGDQTFVLLPGAKGTLTRQIVQTGESGLNNMVTVMGGLKAGDQIIYFGN